MEQLNDNQQDIKLYSQAAIGGATFLGGPLAAGILVRHNYIELGKEDDGKTALIIGIIATVLLFGGIFMVPDELMSKIPNQIIPAIYTAIIYFIVEKIQGEALNQHKANDHEFMSSWRAAGIGFLCMLLIIGALFGYTFYETSNPAYAQYDIQMEKFNVNESKAFEFYDHLETNSDYSLIQELDNRTIPSWKDNLKIVEATNQIENLPAELAQRNVLLSEYCKLQIELFELFRTAINYNTNDYSEEIEQLHQKIEITVNKLQTETY